MQATVAKNTHSHEVAIELQISQLQALIRANPAKVEHRIHLAQLLMVAGQWERCLQQLQTTAQLDPKSTAMAQTYRALIQAEICREQTFNGQRDPLSLGETENWQDLLAEALIARANNQVALAEKFQQQAFDEAPCSTFSINGVQANWIADSDSRLGPICEVFMNGSYYWLPFTQIKQLTLEPPKDLRDLVWTPAKITLVDFSQHFGFLPSRYVFSYQAGNDQLALATLTEWAPLSEQSWAGMGQKMLVTDSTEYSLLSIHSLLQAGSE
ncbi:type VI secretion system accessory protein TagJ [Cellvibrio sp.]